MHLRLSDHAIGIGSCVDPVNVLFPDVFYSLLPIFEFLLIEVALVVREILLLDTSSDNASVFLIHANTWHV